MEMCTQHIDMIENGLRLRGIADMGLEKAEVEMFVRALNGEEAEDDDPQAFSPLVAVQFSLFARAVENGGDYMAYVDENEPSPCPLCELATYTNQSPADWVHDACEEVLAAGVEHGIVPKARMN